MFQDLGNYGCHIVIFIFGEASSEDHIRLFLCQFTVSRVYILILGVVDWIKRLHAVMPFCGVFFGDYSLWIIIDCVAEYFEVFVLNNTGIGNVRRRIIYDCISLPVGCVEDFCFEADGIPVCRNDSRRTRQSFR